MYNDRKQDQQQRTQCSSNLAYSNSFTFTFQHMASQWHNALTTKATTATSFYTTVMRKRPEERTLDECRCCILLRLKPSPSCNPSLKQPRKENYKSLSQLELHNQFHDNNQTHLNNQVLGLERWPRN